MPNMDIPFQPLRNSLYTSLELMSGFDPERPLSAAETLDFQTYRYFTANGGACPNDPYAGMMQALHDHSIMRAISKFFTSVEVPTVAIMGGHDVPRSAARYLDVVHVARTLTQGGCLVASGGGPGTMEATHLGALLATASDQDVADAVQHLRSRPTLPDTTSVVSQTGEVDTAIVRQLHSWAKPAFEIAQTFTDAGGRSLAVPTWHYGCEPLTPLATHVAKYFQNSLREDMLLSLAANGIIYTPGASGTLQEVFQNAAQNYYPRSGQEFSPMIFYGREFWTEKLPVLPVLEGLFVGNAKLTPEEFGRLIRVVDTAEEAVNALLEHRPSTTKMIHRMQAEGFGPILAAAAGSAEAATSVLGAR
ncbi:LOG family protein [Mycobacterium marinum]|uniref:LOG family protein n=1 Tax=Mycobacterium marinum TaxID=1781 RepID=UPI000E3D96E7|nr:LOG family protein [Mycobacterium marinum]MDC9008138.1 LOG family protein [Mycobacterium marinum]QQW33607.1 LOG family protein [Mycobacterium marinum]RFZ64108.1 putative lysine decarboxylase [Mycobacterium marinum]GJO09365.1 hypothetical protein NJB18091_52050 [Mycobacterium marinum]